MYIIIEDLNNTDIYETIPGDRVSFFGTELKDGTAVIEIGIKRMNGDFNVIYSMTNIKMAHRVAYSFLRALEDNDRIFHLSQVYEEGI